MPPDLSAPDLDAVLAQAMTVLSAFLSVVALLLAFVLVFDRFERVWRSPVERLLRRRKG